MVGDVEVAGSTPGHGSRRIPRIHCAVTRGKRTPCSVTKKRRAPSHCCCRGGGRARGLGAADHGRRGPSRVEESGQGPPRRVLLNSVARRPSRAMFFPFAPSSRSPPLPPPAMAGGSTLHHLRPPWPARDGPPPPTSAQRLLGMETWPQIHFAFLYPPLQALLHDPSTGVRQSSPLAAPLLLRAAPSTTSVLAAPRRLQAPGSRAAAWPRQRSSGTPAKKVEVRRRRRSHPH
jgi:hypothetical protein